MRPGAQWPNCSVPDCADGAIATLQAEGQPVGWCVCEGHCDPATLPLDRMCQDTPEGPLYAPLHQAAEAYWREHGYLK